jgi:hypothetical protein
LSETGTVSDPARATLLKTRQAVLAGWEGVAAALDAQGEIELAGDVRYFAKHLPAVLTDRERLAAELIHRVRENRSFSVRREARDRGTELTREPS